MNNPNTTTPPSTMQLRITFFSGDQTNCFPDDSVDCSWEQFCSMYRAGAANAKGAEKASRGYAVFATLRPSTPELLDGIERKRRLTSPGWSIGAPQRALAEEHGYRNADHAISASAVVIDYDKDPAAAPDWRPKAWPGELFAHSTHNYDAKDAPGRWRVFLRLSEPIPFSMYKDVQRALAKVLPPNTIVRAAHQPAFSPTCPADQALAYMSVAGAPLDWKRLLAQHPPAAPLLSTVVVPGSPDVVASDVEEGVVQKLAAVMPVSGDGNCHTAALALGGVLSDTEWSTSRCIAFAGRVFAAADLEGAHLHSAVATSIANRRNDPGAEVYGWPTLRRAMDDRAESDAMQIRAACDAFAALLEPPPPELEIGDDVEIAQHIVNNIKQLKGAVFTEGSLWRQDKAGVWVEIEVDEVYRWTADFSGAKYNVQVNEKTGKVTSSVVRVSAGTCASVYKVCCSLLNRAEHTNFFSEGPVGIPFRDGFLKVGRTKEESVLLPLHECRVRRVLPFNAPRPGELESCPPTAWMGFLKSVWGKDIEAVCCLHEILGYLLSGSLAQQKMFVFVGPPRAGKGVVLKVLQGIFGPALGTFKIAALDKDFALQGLLGKSVSIDPDVRRGKGFNRDDGAIAERLLSTTAGDLQSIPRKYRTSAQVTLPCRLVVATNPPFGLADVGSALSKRMVMLQFPTSFLGREDTELSTKLLAELPGIVAMALEGLYSLQVRGRFQEPESSQEERSAARHIENPMLGFLEEECDLEEGARTPCVQLYEACKQWLIQNGHRLVSTTRFSEMLRQHGVEKVHPRVCGERLPRHYEGIGLIRQKSLSIVR